MWSPTLRVCVMVTMAVFLSACGKGKPQKAEPALQHAAQPSDEKPSPDGAALFKRYCSTCHPDGGNTSDPKRSLHGTVLKEMRITSPEDIVRIMRNPVSRMIRFDKETLSDKEALAIAEYILKAFK